MTINARYYRRFLCHASSSPPNNRAVDGLFHCIIGNSRRCCRAYSKKPPFHGTEVDAHADFSIWGSYDHSALISIYYLLLIKEQSRERIEYRNN